LIEVTAMGYSKAPLTSQHDMLIEVTAMGYSKAPLTSQHGRC
jgi:hypothetical protein